MKTAKRFPTLAAIFAALAFTLFACSSDGGGDSSDPGASSSSSGGGSSSSLGSSSSVGGSSSSEGSGSSSSSSGGDPVVEPSTPKCGEEEYDPATHECHASAAYPKCVDGADETCFANGAVNISVPKCAGNPQGYDPSLYECKEGKNGIYLKSGLEDGRDGKKYAAVLIGTQTWMAENLNYAAEGSRCYGDNTGGNSQNRCGTYGRLYNWATAMDIVATYNSTSYTATLPHQGVCPEGWHLPSDAEWTALTTVTGTEPGKKLKASNALWTTNTGTDDYGFSALPGGNGDPSGSDSNVGISGSFHDVGSRGDWWSSTQNNASDARSRYMLGSYSFVRTSYDGKSNLYSVRCVYN